MSDSVKIPEFEELKELKKHSGLNTNQDSLLDYLLKPIEPAKDLPEDPVPLVHTILGYKEVQLKDYDREAYDCFINWKIGDLHETERFRVIHYENEGTGARIAGMYYIKNVISDRGKLPIYYRF